MTIERQNKLNREEIQRIKDNISEEREEDFS